MESAWYEEFGNLMTATFSDYCPITMPNMPTSTYENMEPPSPLTFKGEKELGEGRGGPLHTISVALQYVLAAYGVVIYESQM